MHSQSGRDATAAPPSYDDLFGGAPGQAVTEHGRRSSSHGAGGHHRAPVSSHRAGSLRDHSDLRANPSAPAQLVDGLEGLQIGDRSGVASPPSYPSGSCGGRQNESSHVTQDEFPEPFAASPNWQEREEEQELRSWFTAVDENDDGFITTAELQQALLNDNWTTFSSETITMILKMFDKDFNNRIDFSEFSQIKKYVTQWKSIFDRYDVDRSGTIDVEEIREAFLGMGHEVSLVFCQKLGKRFCQKTPGKINLDAFIYISATVTSLFKEYRRSSNHNRTFEEVLLKWIR